MDELLIKIMSRKKYKGALINSPCDKKRIDKAYEALGESINKSSPAKTALNSLTIKTITKL